MLPPYRGFQSRPDLDGTFGMCATTHWTASGCAQSVLERGGNAFDAAVAAAFVLHVVEPHLNGPGGDAVVLFARRGRTPTVLCGQGPAPAGATIPHMRDLGLDLVPGSGALSAAVPGAVDAWLLLLEDHGTWELEDVLAYAIALAQDGVPLLAQAAEVIASVVELFVDHWPTSADQWLTDSRPPAAGTIVSNPTYARTLERLVAAGRDRAGPGADRAQRVRAAREEWRGGFVAEAIDAFVRSGPHRHADGGEHHGVLAREDLEGWTAAYEEPVSLAFGGHTVHKAPAWSQGPVLLQALAMLAGDTPDLDTADGIHLVTEVVKLAMADREAHYGDGVPRTTIDRLLGTAYAAERRQRVGSRAATSLDPGRLHGDPFVPPVLAPGGAGGAVGEPTVSMDGATEGDTCHLDIVDRWGNVVAATPSGGWLQSSPHIPELGFNLGTRLQMAWLDEQAPSALRPGARPRTTLTPTLLSRGEEGVGALGSPGGDNQDQWQLNYLLRTLVSGMSPQQAIDAPSFNTTSFPASFWPRPMTPAGLVVEGRVADDVVEDLSARGHEVTRMGAWSLGRLSVVGRDPASGRLFAAANPRGAQGYAVGR